MSMTKIAVISAAALLLAGCEAKKAPAPPPGPAPANPAQPGPDQLVHLVWKQATSEWMVKLNGGPEQPPAQAHTSLAPGVGPTKFVVDITNYPTATFKDPGGLAVWVGAKSASQQGINSTQILGPIVTDNGRKLIFYDLNQGSPVTLNYELHFNGGVKSVDPIIDNGGGNN